MASNEAIVGHLRALLTLDSAEFDNGLRKVSKSFKSMEKDWGTLGRKMTTLGTQFTKILTLPILAAGTAAAKMAIDFESSFAGVRKTVDATEAEFANLAKGLRGLSKVIPINVNELNQIAEAAGQLGIETKNILGFTETMAKLGVTTNLSAEDAAKSLARLANITQMPQTEFDRLGSVIVDLGNKLATSESEIVDFGLRIAGAGKIAGLTEHQILAIGGALSSVGVNAEAGGTAVQRVLVEMTQAVADGNKNLEVFAATAGLSAEQFADAFRKDAAGAFAAFVSGLDRAGTDAFAVLDRLKLGNQRVITSMISLAGAGELLSRSLDTASEAWAENSALTEEARKRFETTASQLTLLWNNLKDVGITIGNALLPMIKSANESLKEWLPTLERAANWFADLDPAIQKTGVAIGLLLAALGPAIFVFGQLALSVSALAGAFTVGLLPMLGAIHRAVVVAIPTFLAWGSAIVGVVGGALTGLGARLALLMPAIGGFGAALAGLGPIAVAVGGAFAGWNIGKWIGDLSGLTDWFGRLSARAGEFIGLLPEGTAAQYDQAQAARRLTEALQKLKDGYVDLRQQLQALAAKDMSEMAGATAAMKLQAEELAKFLPASEIEIENLTRAVQELNSAGQLTPRVVQEIASRAEALQAAGRELTPELEAMVRRISQVDPAAEAAARAAEAFADEASDLSAVLSDAARKTKELDDAYNKLMSDINNERGLAFMERDLFDLQQRMTDFNWPNLAEEMTPDWDAEWRRITATFDQIPTRTKEEADKAAQLWIDTMTAAGQRVPEAMIPPPNVWKQEFENAFAAIQADLGDVILRTLMGGGDVGRAAGSFIGQQFGEAFQEKVTDVLSGSLGTRIGGALGGFLPGLGALAGSFIGKGLAALFNLGGPSEQELEGRATAENFRQGLLSGLSESQMSEVQAAIEGAWRGNELGAATVISVRDAYVATGRSAEEAMAVVTRLHQAEREGAEAVLAVQREIQGVFDEQTADAQRLDAAIQKYGFSLSELGPTLQKQELDAQAKELIQDWTVLNAAGIDLVAVNEKMGESMSAFLQTALQVGAEVPAAMRPILQSMIDQGTLLDENGEAITGLEDIGIRWSETMSDVGDRIVAKLQQVIDTLNGAGQAIENLPRQVDIGVNYQQGQIPMPEFEGRWREMFQQMQQGGAGFSVPSFAHEGRVTAPTFAMIGDATEPEYVLHESTVRGLADSGANGSASVIERAVRRMESLISVDLPRMIERGVTDSLATSQMLPTT